MLDGRGAVRAFKAPTTPQSPADGVIQVLLKAARARGLSLDEFISGIELLVHGTTLATNAVIERRGARTALVATDGFRDVYEIGRINRPDAYNLFFQKHQPLIERALCFEVKERVRADGEVLIPLDEEGLIALGDKIAALGMEAVAIMFINCYANASHEARAKEILTRRYPNLFVTASHELSQEYREFERVSTAAANAYIGPKVRRYIGEIDDHIRKDGFKGSFLIVQSTGGLYESEQAQTHCVRMLESGPAAGVIGTQALCRTLGIENAIAFDMGGTTAKAGVIHKGEALTTGAALIGGYDKALPIQIAMMDIFEVGTGGGSIARAEDGAMRVGPQSAGAVPGPVCYGRGGTQPTVTDAHLALGHLPDGLLDGSFTLDRGAARRAIDEKIARPLGLSVDEAARGGGKKPARMGLKHPTIAPYGAYTCADGKAVLISIQNEREWSQFCADVLGDAALATDAFRPRALMDRLNIEVIATTEGALDTLSPTLQPLAPYKQDVTILSNLTHNTGRALLDGAGDHGRCCGSYLTGVQVKKTLTDIKASVSCDQLVANAIGRETRFPSLEVGLEDARQAGDCDSGYSCAYTNNLAWRSQTQPLPPVLDPRAMFERLFGADSGVSPQERALRNKYRRSILDFVAEDTRTIQSTLGPTDKRKLDEYFTSVREIETQIEKAEKVAQIDPGIEKPIGIPNDFADHFKLMTDMITIAFQADLTRVVTFLVTHEGTGTSGTGRRPSPEAFATIH